MPGPSINRVELDGRHGFPGLVGDGDYGDSSSVVLGGCLLSLHRLLVDPPGAARWEAAWPSLNEIMSLKRKGPRDRARVAGQRAADGRIASARAAIAPNSMLLR
jgi:hypothetical protein